MSLFKDFCFATLTGAVASGVPAPSLSNPTPIALVYRTTSTGSLADGTILAFTNEKYDNESAFAPTDNEFVIASNGLYRCVGGDYTSASATGFSFSGTVAGSAVNGGSLALSADSTPRWSTAATAIISLTTSQAPCLFTTGGTAAHNTSGSYIFHSIERVDPNTWYALIQKSGNQTGVAAGSVLTWDTETVDTGNWFDTAVSTSQFKVPIGSGITRVRLSASVVQSSGTLACVYRVRKNGSFSGIPGLPGKARHSNNGDAYIPISGPPIIVSEGDLFDLYMDEGSSRTVNSSWGTWFSIEQVPAGVKACLVYANSGTITTTDDNVAFPNTEYKDDSGMHDNVTNNYQIVIPSGCTYARMYWFIRSSTNARIQVQAAYTGGNVGAGVDNEGSASKAGYSAGTSAWVPVTAGDICRIVASASANATIAEAWFGVECV